MEPEREVDDHAEVTAAATKCPEEVGVLALVGADDAPVRGHDRCGEQVVERQAVDADQVADAAAEREPRDARVAEGAARRRQTVPLAHRVEVLPERAAAARRRPCVRIDIDLADQAEVDDQASVADAVARDAVSTAANGDGQLRLGGVTHGGGDVGHVEGTGDERRVAVDHAVERHPRRVVAGVCRRDHRAPVAQPQAIDCRGDEHRASMTRTFCRRRPKKGLTRRVRPFFCAGCTYFAHVHLRALVGLAAASDPVQRSVDRRNSVVLAAKPARWRGASFDGRVVAPAFVDPLTGVGLGAFIGRLDRLAGRFNRWFGGAAVALSAEHSGSAGGPPTVDPTAVVAALGEIERQRGSDDEGDRAEPGS